MFFGETVEYAILTPLEKQKCQNILNKLSKSPQSFFQQKEFSDVEKVKLIIVLLEMGVSPQALFNFLDWQKFEQVVSMLFDKNGFETITNFHFKSEESKHEIDILAFQYPYLYAIDCKFVRKQTDYQLKNAAFLQKERVDILVSNFFLYSDFLLKKLHLPKKRRLFVVPLIVSWHSGSLSLYEGVGLVPFKGLIGFVRNIDSIKEDLFVLQLQID